MKKLLFVSLALTTAVFARSVTIDVVEHRPIYESKPVTRMVEDCPSDNQNIIGTVGGAVVGGIVGNQFGGGSGRKLATVGGAIAGGVLGNKIEGDMKKDSGCTYKEVTTYEDVIVGYENIGYYEGRQYKKTTKEKQPRININVD
ncbi:MAG: glycine zipper 2TM domain-containing protein [Campylobacteraceae bacterium]|nr:glycine zipper 2TM domain-containing protein [Campylobacteraceae bacterium]